MIWRVVLDTGRLGDWLYVQAPDEDAARKAARRKTRRPIAYVRPLLNSEGWREWDRENGVRRKPRAR